MSKFIIKVPGFLASSENSKTKQVKPLKQSDIDSMKRHLESIDEFLELAGTDQLSQSVKQCFIAWGQLLPLQAENDRAEIVLSAFYQSGKIRDTLKKLQNFVDRMDTVDSDDTARGMGYHNYIFYLQEYLDALKKQYNEVRPNLEQPECTPDNVAWFIGVECGQIAPIQDLPKVRTAARQMLEQAEVDKRPPEKFASTLSAIGAAREMLGIEQKKRRMSTDGSYGEAIEKLEKLGNILNTRAEALRENIQKGKELYNSLIVSMTEEWLQQFNPEASLVQEMTRIELKSFYQERLNALRLPEEEEKG